MSPPLAPLLFLATSSMCVVPFEAAEPLDATCTQESCEPVSSLMQSAHRLYAGLGGTDGGVLNGLSSGLLGSTGAAGPQGSAALQVAGLAGGGPVPALRTGASAESLLAQIKNQAEQAVSRAQALPQIAKDLLSNFSVEVDQMIDSLHATHDETQTQINKAYSDLEACEEHWTNATDTIDTQNSTTQDSEEDHADCRNSIGENSTVLCEGLETIIDQMRSDPLNCTVPEPRLEAECEAAPTVRPFIESVKIWAEDYLAQYTEQKDACQDALAQDIITEASCEEKQGKYEGDFCELHQVVNVSIESYEACRTVQLAELEVVEVRNETNEVNRNEYIALTKIQCYLKVLLDYDGDNQLAAQANQLEYCNIFVVDTSMFDLTFPEEAAPLNFTAVTEEVTPIPGEEAWIPLYDPAWGITEVVSPCILV